MQTTAPSSRVATTRAAAGTRPFDLRKAATAALFLLPATIVYLMFQRYFVSGLTSGAVKG